MALFVMRKRKTKRRKILVVASVLMAVTVITCLIIFWPRPRPATFELSNFSVTPAEAFIGDMVTITADVSNTGEITGTYTAVLTINGVTVETKDILVAGGATETVTFTVVRDEAGTYNIGVNGLTRTLTVKARLIVISPEEPTIPQSGLIYRNYEWSYKSEKYILTTSIPGGLYEYYKSKPRPPTRNYSVYVTDPRDDEWLGDIVKSFNKFALEEGLSESEKINLMIAFVQSLPYTPDDVTTPYDEYPRYPVETLVDNGGDCEDASILMAALLDQMGHDIILISPPEHMAVGISGKDVFYGSYWELDNKWYFYLETTGEGWEIGEVPENYKGISAYLYPIEPTPILTHSWEAEYITYYTIELTVTVKNEGTAIAKDVYVFAGFDAGKNKVWNPEESDKFDLSLDSEANVILHLDVPKNKYTRLVVQIVHGGYAVDQSYSKWFNT
jgi:hypothetical protein